MAGNNDAFTSISYLRNNLSKENNISSEQRKFKINKEECSYAKSHIQIGDITEISQGSGGGRLKTSNISRQLIVEKIDQQIFRDAKQSFVTRRVEQDSMSTLIKGPIRPRTGDLALAQVERIHFQRRLELTNGRKATLEPGDKIIVAYGDRYATDQFEAEIPLDLGTTNLVATGGIASRMLSRNGGIRPASIICPLGLIGDGDGVPLNLSRFAASPPPLPDRRPIVMAVLGTSMNSGKTTINYSMVNGLRRAGHRPGVAKITGTGSGGDYWLMVDAGAHAVVDFTDAGYAATYKLSIPQIEYILQSLIAQLIGKGANIILIEIADGIFQEQNVELIRSPLFGQLVDKVIFAAGEAMGALMGIHTLQEAAAPLIGISGKMTASELAIRECRAASTTPVYTRAELSDPSSVCNIIGIPLEGDLPLVDVAPLTSCCPTILSDTPARSVERSIVKGKAT